MLIDQIDIRPPKRRTAVRPQPAERTTDLGAFTPTLDEGLRQTTHPVAELRA